MSIGLCSPEPYRYWLRGVRGLGSTASLLARSAHCGVCLKGCRSLAQYDDPRSGLTAVVVVFALALVLYIVLSGDLPRPHRCSRSHTARRVRTVKCLFGEHRSRNVSSVPRTLASQRSGRLLSVVHNAEPHRHRARIVGGVHRYHLVVLGGNWVHLREISTKTAEYNCPAGNVDRRDVRDKRSVAPLHRDVCRALMSSGIVRNRLEVGCG